MSIDWAETKMILLEVEQLFNRDDDVKDIFDIGKMQHEIEQHCENSLKDAKDLIKEMTNRVSAKESEVVAPTEAAHSVELDKAIDEKENVSKQVESLRHVIDLKREKVYSLASNSLQLREKIAAAAASNQITDARTSYALSLYGKISNISWDYEMARGRLGGYIGNDSTQELKRFEMDTRTLTSFELANQLWDMIAENS